MPGPNYDVKRQALRLLILLIKPIFPMRFKIQYFKQDRLVAERPWDGTFSGCKKVAKDALAIHNVDTVKVFDSTGQEAFKVKQHASGTPRPKAQGRVISSAVHLTRD